MTATQQFETVWPGGQPAVEVFSPASRPAELNGLRIAFVWDYLFRGDEIFAILEETLGQAYPDATFLSYGLFGNTLGADDHRVLSELPAKLAEHKVDVVISGVGCCGACTPAVIRASAIAEKAGVPTASLVCEGFAGQARAVSPGLGCAWLPVVEMPGYVESQSDAELREMILSHTRDAVVRCLTEAPVDTNTQGASSCAARRIVAIGDFAGINRRYLDEGWSDGLPIVPPTIAAVEAFLRHTPDSPDRLIGGLQPSGASVTAWNVAVNGVMAGCEPTYMPVLIAIAEIMVNPAYGIEHSGDTTGGDPLIVLNGPVITQLGFNTGNGAMRDGARANSTVGRFLRLFMRNVAGLRPGGADKSTFGRSARIVLAEQEGELETLGWTTYGDRLGYPKGTNLVTIARYTGDVTVGSIYGRDPEDIARYLADGLVRQSGWELVFTAGLAPGTCRPLVAISPMVAKTLAKAGSDPQDLRERLFRLARIPASRFESYIGKFSNMVPGRRTLLQLHEAGLAADIFALSDDPHRLVPVVTRPEDILIAVSGDPFRSNGMVFGSNGVHGFLTSQEIRMA
ncbi:UGSC family (seleno)protein [Tistrella sp. BH-R2-4]|uniref:UGSC family (Seleno)protein n=1 Tax=Tistrella arctica TaxID=3133430 RepID=A0ABU9YHT9_9PROT